jgi:hypothetical protein
MEQDAEEEPKEIEEPKKEPEEIEEAKEEIKEEPKKNLVLNKKQLQK